VQLKKVEIAILMPKYFKFLNQNLPADTGCTIIKITKIAKVMFRSAWEILEWVELI
jgi:hypothetical protein